MILGYLSLLLIVPGVLMMFKPYKEWEDRPGRRRLVNYTAYVLLGIFGTFGVMYLNA